ncbi:26S proteasome regulatory subunit T2, partial [Pancytospora epiphaga]
MGNTSGTPKKTQDNTAINIRKKKHVKESKSNTRLPTVTPTTKCKLRQLRLAKIQTFLKLEKQLLSLVDATPQDKDGSRVLVDQLRGSPLSIGTLEEFIDDNHAIVSSALGLDYYSVIMSFVDKDLLEPGCTVILNNKDQTVVGVLEGDVDPLVSVMKLEKAPTETYADIGGLESQIQEIKESVELPLTNP